MNQELNTMKDSQLINMFIAQSSYEALSVLVNRHKNTLYTSIKIITKEKELSEDIFQETWIKIIDSLKSSDYTDKNKFISWAMRIAHNLCIDHFRRVKIKKNMVNRVMKDDKLLMNLYYPDESIDEKTQKIQKRDNLRKIIETLPESQKEVVLLFYFEHLKFKEIAELTNSKINTVLGRMHRAIENLREIKMKSYLNL